jgi:hypothetical protein
MDHLHVLTPNMAVLSLLVVLPLHLSSITAPNTIVAEIGLTLDMTLEILLVANIIVMLLAMIVRAEQSPVAQSSAAAVNVTVRALMKRCSWSGADQEDGRMPKAVH